MGDPNTESGSVAAPLRPGDRDGADDSGGSDADLDAGSVRCDTCETTIGPQEFRLTRLLEDGYTTHERHYCSEMCFPDGQARSSGASDGVRDWSYCR
ncbi:hypothetical protein D8Y22_07115 [Salinadaptatus halalkaliphilus]|uniref:Uncharacterized protein n=1 Tax=Salinadaptatus halalkaliphilus TaxID=2419781 RepID=A0A4V3VLG4_9EURY|nr:hypothetical protein [Salinadaptatus halalkaliphilus]THE65577.1 hypothetical protein D8Y22_07115 [Salinadaptatus halalkaliphilus]